MTTHLHLYFVPWHNESRAWRAGTAALEAGLADHVFYVGHKAAGAPDREDIAPGQTVLRLGAEPPRPGSPRLVRALALPRWWRECLRRSASERPSLVVAHSLAALPVAVMIARRAKAPLLYDAHELETERNGWAWPIRKIARWVEAACIRHAAHTLVVNRSIEDWYRAAYPGVSVSTVRNVPEALRRTGESPMRQVLNIAPNAMIFVYCGMLAEGRGLEELVEAFEGLSEERHLVLVGSGPLEGELQRRVGTTANVHLHAAIPHARLVDFLSGADVGVMVPSSTALSYRYCLPNKVFEYAAAGLAICVGDGPELQRFARSYPAARTSAPTVQALRSMALSWTRDELARARPLIERFQPPTWEQERAVLMSAYERAGLPIPAPLEPASSRRRRRAQA